MALFWVSVVMLRGGLIGALLIVLLAGCCFGFPFFSLPASPIPLTADRILLAVLVVQYVMFRQWGWTDPKPLAKSDYVFGAFMLAMFASTFTHDFAYRKMMPVAQLLFFFVMPAVMFWVARQAAWTRQNVWWLLSSLTVFGLYLSFTAVAEVHAWWDLVFPKYIASSESREFFGRGRGPLLNPAANGVILGLGLCALLAWWPRCGWLGKSLVLAGVPVFAWGLYATLTRSAWMGAALVLLVVVTLLLPRAWRTAVIASAVVGGALLLVVDFNALLSFKRDKDVSAEDVAESAKLRPILALIAWNMFLDRPLLGCGFGQYETEMLPYLSDRSSDLPLEKARPYIQHNVFLALLAETGLVGMGLFTALLVIWTHRAWHLWNQPGAELWVRQVGLLFLAFMGAYLPNAMFHNLSLVPMVNMVLFFLGGAVMGITPDREENRANERLKQLVGEPQLVAAG